MFFSKIKIRSFLNLDKKKKGFFEKGFLTYLFI